MYGGYRGRAGPSKDASATVQCQKCLQRDRFPFPMHHLATSSALEVDTCCRCPKYGMFWDIFRVHAHISLVLHYLWWNGSCILEASLTSPERHYSYECKAPPQERPYVPRPSRTQQLKNPKLLPKLSNDVLPDDPLTQRKKEVAAEESAKKETERARKRELEREAPPSKLSPPPKRRRSPSFDSVSSISTRSPSPPRRRRVSKSPPRELAHGSRDPGRPAASPRRRSFSSGGGYPSRHSESPERSPRRRTVSGGRSLSRSPSRSISRSQSPPPRREQAPIRGRQTSYSERNEQRPVQPRREDSRSLSPAGSPAGRVDQRAHLRAPARYRDRDDHSQPPRRNPSPPPRRNRSPAPPREPVAPPPPRERSLSPFSKRLALTKAMKRDGN